MIGDLCIRTSDVERCLELGRELGLDFITLLVPPGDLSGLNKAQKNRDWRTRPVLSYGTEIRAKKPSQVVREARSVRKSAEVLVARGGTEDLNRAVLETPEIDVLISHDLEGRPGINHVLAKLARKNSVAIAFDFNSIMMSYRLGRIQEFSSMVETAKLVRKFSSPFVLTSGALDPWDMRSGSELIALGNQLGFSTDQSRKALGNGIIRENRKRLSGKWVMPGVEIE